MKLYSVIFGIVFFILSLYTKDLSNVVVGCMFFIYAKIDLTKEEILKIIERKQNEN